MRSGKSAAKRNSAEEPEMLRLSFIFLSFSILVISCREKPKRSIGAPTPAEVLKVSSSVGVDVGSLLKKYIPDSSGKFWLSFSGSPNEIEDLERKLMDANSIYRSRSGIFSAENNAEGVDKYTDYKFADLASPEWTPIRGAAAGSKSLLVLKSSNSSEYLLIFTSLAGGR